MPDEHWPNIRNPLQISEADHAAHTSPRGGIPHPHHLGMDDRKAASKLLKGIKKSPKLKRKKK